MKLHNKLSEHVGETEGATDKVRKADSPIALEVAASNTERVERCKADTYNREESS